jgi:hypothetical protein
MTKKQAISEGSLRSYTLHLPLSQAARVEALCESYPHKRREEVLADLVCLGLGRIEQLWPHAVAGEAVVAADTGRSVYLPTGPFDEFHGLVRKHHDALAVSDAGDRTSTPSAPSGLPDNP